jgi:hypothetical protein
VQNETMGTTRKRNDNCFIQGNNGHAKGTTSVQKGMAIVSFKGTTSVQKGTTIVKFLTI